MDYLHSMFLQIISVVFLLAAVYYLASVLKELKGLRARMDKLSVEFSEAIREHGDRLDSSIVSMHKDLMTEEDEVRSLVRSGIPRDIAWEHVHINKS